MLDPDASVDLCQLIQNLKAKSVAQFKEVLERWEPGVQGDDACHQLCKRSHRNLVHLMMHAYYAERGYYQEAIEEIQTRLDCEKRISGLLKCGQTMAPMREKFSADLSRGQHDVEAASTMLCGGSLANVGWPAMTEDLIAKADKSLVAWPLRKEEYDLMTHNIMLEMLHRFSISSCPKDPQLLRASVCSNGLHLVAGGTFTTRMIFDLRRWLVLEASTHIFQGYKTVLPNCDEFFRQHLQEMVDAAMQDNRDVLDSLFHVGHAFCASLRLRLLRGKALEIAEDRPNELCRISLQDALQFRICPEMDLSAGGLVAAEHDVGTAEARPSYEFYEDSMLDKARLAQEEIRQDSELRVVSQASLVEYLGCDVRLSVGEMGCLDVETRPDLGMQQIEPWVMEASKGLFMKELVSDLQKRLKSQHLQNIRAAFVEQGLFKDQEMMFDQGGPLLSVILRGCALDIKVDDLGRMSVFADGYSEQEKVSLRLASRDLCIFERVRWGACFGILTRTAREHGWEALSELPVGTSTASAVQPTPSSAGVKCIFGIPGHSMQLHFTISDSTVSNASLKLVYDSTGSSEAAHPKAASKLACAIEVPKEINESFASVCFADSAGQGFRVLRDKFDQSFAAASKVANFLVFSISVLKSVAEFALSKQMVGCSAADSASSDVDTISLAGHQHKGAHLSAKLLENGLACTVHWCPKEDEHKDVKAFMPFIAPLKIYIEENQQRWTLSGNSRFDISSLAALRKTLVRDDELLSSGGKVLRADALLLPQRVELQYRRADNWQAWPRDLKAIALMLDLTQQAAEQLDPSCSHIRLERQALCNLRFQLTGTPGTAQEIFELSPTLPPSSASEHSAASAAQASKTTLAAICSFRWISPTKPLLLGPQLSQWICCSRDFAALVSNLPVVIELCRVVEQLRDTGDPEAHNDDWVIDGLGATKLGITCRSLLGIKMSISSAGRVKIKPLAPDYYGTLPRFDEFLSSLSSPSEGAGEHLYADPGIVQFKPGELHATLKPLWDYLCCHCVLLQLFLNEVRILGGGKDDVENKYTMTDKTENSQSTLAALERKTEIGFTWRLEVAMERRHTFTSDTQDALCIDGDWTKASIKGNQMKTKDGKSIKLLDKTPTSLAVEINGKTHTGEVRDDGKLYWSDGDVWLRVIDQLEGTWHYENFGSSGTYRLTADGPAYRFKEVTRKGHTNIGLLTDCGEWFEGALRNAGKTLGHLRIKHCNGNIISNFRGVDADKWGKDVIAERNEMPARKRRKLEAKLSTEPNVQVYLRWRSTVLSFGPGICGFEGEPDPEEALRNRCLSVVEGWFDHRLKDPTSWRFHRVKPVLSLFNAPALWMLEEFTRLLPPLRMNHGLNHYWQPNVDLFEFSSDRLAHGTDIVFGCVLEQKVVNSDRVCETLKVRCTTQHKQLEKLPEGWQSIVINGRSLEDWAQITLGKSPQQLGIHPESKEPLLLVKVIESIMKALDRARR